MARKGRELETLVKSIENALKTHPKGKVESPAFLVDKTTGRKREFDVLITLEEGPRIIQTGIECRKRKSKVGSPGVEAFVAKCKDTTVNFMAIVSSLGFTKEAVKKAAHHGLQCLTLKDAVAFQWLEAKEIFHSTLNLSHISIGLPEDVKPPEGIRICEQNGTPIAQPNLEHYAIGLIQKYAPKGEGVGEFAMNFHLTSETSGLFALTTDGKVWPLDKALMELKYSRAVSSTPLKLHTYTDVSKGEGITNVAAAGFSTGGMDFDIMIVEQKDGSKNVMLVKK